MHSALKPRLRPDCRFAAGRSHTNVSFWLLADALAGLPGGPDLATSGQIGTPLLAAHSKNQMSIFADYQLR